MEQAASHARGPRWVPTVGDSGTGASRYFRNPEFTNGNCEQAKREMCTMLFTVEVAQLIRKVHNTILSAV